MNKWREASIEVIVNTIEENKGKSKAHIINAVKKAYPFGERKYLPYKIWLEERKRLFFLYNLYEAPKSRKCKYHPNGQTCLFCKDKNIKNNEVF